jgi:ribonuclease P protein component
VLQRLKSREEFTQALKTPVVARTVHFVLHGPRDVTDAHSIGCVLPKRWAKRAVTRNLLRRLIWATASAQLLEAKAGTYVVRLRSVVSSQSHPSASSPALRQQLRQELQTLFAQTVRSTSKPQPSA